MSENKHTPGPWTVRPAYGENNELCFHEIRGPDNRTLASTWARPREADAYLIAAAPDMLAALKEMMMWMPSGFAPQSKDNAMKMANEAIVKAEGKTP